VNAAGTMTIGTRGSRLALTQSRWVAAQLRLRHPELEVRLLPIRTSGDVLADQPLSDIGGRGFFVGEIEAALLSGAIDLAVHSAKDLPSVLPAGLALAAFPRRTDPRDVLISNAGTLDTLPAGARVGTSSPRRTCQVRARRPDLVPRGIRGNVDSRLRKLAYGEYDAIVLAAAGLLRLGREGEITEWFSPDSMVPAVGQGALALEVREDDQRTAGLVAPLHDRMTALAVRAERAFLRRFGAGCNAAIAAHASVAGELITLTGFLGHPDGRYVQDVRRGTDALALGDELAGELLARGGTALLATV
jgi:hydroxymethylbilane synthase